MKLGFFAGGICIAISLGLIYLDQDFQVTTPYFKGIILGLGIGLFIGNTYGYLNAKASLKRSLVKKIKKPLSENIQIFEEDEKKENIQEFFSRD